jgi:hypothetical protein
MELVSWYAWRDSRWNVLFMRRWGCMSGRCEMLEVGKSAVRMPGKKETTSFLLSKTTSGPSWWKVGVGLLNVYC